VTGVLAIGSNVGQYRDISKLWVCAKGSPTTEEINNKLLLAADNEGRNAWHLAAMSDIIKALQTLWKCAKENLTTGEIINKLLLVTDNEGWTTCHLEVNLGQYKYINKIVVVLKRA